MCMHQSMGNEFMVGAGFVKVGWCFLAEFGFCTTRSFTLIPLAALLFVSSPKFYFCAFPSDVCTLSDRCIPDSEAHYSTSFFPTLIKLTIDCKR
jgi:hypothetical protein